MLEWVWWCKHCEMKSWNQTICCLMNCSNKRKHKRIGGGKRSHATLKCCWKEKVLLSTHAKGSKQKGRWSTINLAAMIKTTRAQLFKYIVGAMVAICMSPMPPNVIKREACLHAKSFYGLLKDLRLERCPNIWRKDETK
jgi:hypothetical protein